MNDDGSIILYNLITYYLTWSWIHPINESKLWWGFGGSTEPRMKVCLGKGSLDPHFNILVYKSPTIVPTPTIACKMVLYAWISLKRKLPDVGRYELDISLNRKLVPNFITVIKHDRGKHKTEVTFDGRWN